MSIVTARQAASALSLVVLAVALAGCGSATHADPLAPSTSTGPTPKTADAELSGWLMTRQVLAEISDDAAARRKIAASTVDELLKPGQQPVAGVPARTVVSFSSAIELESAVRTGALPRHTYAVLYDPEAWSFTPLSEQRNPVAAAAGAAAVAHAHGLRFVVAPALNLVKVLSSTSRGTRAHQFLALKLARRMARTADVLELQAQSLERDGRAYGAFISASAGQARAGNAGVRVLAGLSTNPPGASVALSQLRSDIAATRSQVNGYWLNVPGRGARCPTCSTPRPDLAIALTLRP